MDNITAKTIENQYHHLVEAEQYTEAYDLITQHFDLYEGPLQHLAYLWRIEMACKLSEAELAFQLLKEAVDSGFWYWGLLEDPIWQTVENKAAFQQIEDICQQRRAKTMADAKPVIKVMTPEAQREVYPLLFALHGGGNVEDFSAHWQAASANGWLVGLPQSPESRGPDTFVWNDWDWVIPAVEAHYVHLGDQYPIDSTSVVLGGFSMGAALALWLVFNQLIDAQAVIVIAPYVNVKGLEKVLDKSGNADKRVFIVAGQADTYCHQVAQDLSEVLPSYGIQCEFRSYGGLGHGFPPDFDRVLLEALAYVLSE